MFCSRKAPSCGSPRATENYWCSMRPSCFFAKKNNCYVKYEHEDDAAAPVRVHVAEVALGKQSLFAISRRGGFSYYCPSPRFPAARPARLPSSGAPSTLLLSPRRFAAAPYTPFVRVVSALAYARSPRRPARSLLEHKKTRDDWFAAYSAPAGDAVPRRATRARARDPPTVGTFSQVTYISATPPRR